jgi:hypothetical protein
MKTFDDIKWSKHGIPGAIQGKLVLNSGLELSIVAGEFLYCTPKVNNLKVDEYTSFEVAIFSELGSMIGDPMGWQSRDEINTLISKN